jgi:hypothetical protein
MKLISRTKLQGRVYLPRSKLPHVVIATEDKKKVVTKETGKTCPKL